MLKNAKSSTRPPIFAPDELVRQRELYSHGEVRGRLPMGKAAFFEAITRYPLPRIAPSKRTVLYRGSDLESWLLRLERKVV